MKQAKRLDLKYMNLCLSTIDFLHFLCGPSTSSPWPRKESWSSLTTGQAFPNSHYATSWGSSETKARTRPKATSSCFSTMLKLRNSRRKLMNACPKQETSLWYLHFSWVTDWTCVNLMLSASILQDARTSTTLCTALSSKTETFKLEFTSLMSATMLDPTQPSI